MFAPAFVDMAVVSSADVAVVMLAGISGVVVGATALGAAAVYGCSADVMVVGSSVWPWVPREK